jgi:hypothetical protein
MLNEGGLFAEVSESSLVFTLESWNRKLIYVRSQRMGYHLPGYDDSEWESRDLAAGLTKSGAGFFRTTFDLGLPAGYDVGIR